MTDFEPTFHFFQLIPHLVMDIFTNNPGLPGLFLAAVYSGSLRFVETSPAKTLKSFIQQHLSQNESSLV